MSGLLTRMSGRSKWAAAEFTVAVAWLRLDMSICRGRTGERFDLAPKLAAGSHIEQAQGEIRAGLCLTQGNGDPSPRAAPFTRATSKARSNRGSGLVMINRFQTPESVLAATTTPGAVRKRRFWRSVPQRVHPAAYGILPK